MNTFTSVNPMLTATARIDADQAPSREISHRSSKALFSLRQQRCNADKLMIGVSWLLFLFALILAEWHDAYLSLALIGAPAALVPSLLALSNPGSLVSRVGFGCGFMIMSALHIHQAQGMIEMHFGIFILLAFLLFYRDWIPIVVAALVIAVHHLWFNYLQATGWSVYAFTKEAGLGLVFLHAAYVVFETGVLVLIATKLRREAIETEEVYSVVGSLLSGNSRIDLRDSAVIPQSCVGKALKDVMQKTHGVLRETQEVTGQLNNASGEMTELAEIFSHKLRSEEAETERAALGVTEASDAVHMVAQRAAEAAKAAEKVDAAAQEGTRALSDSQKVVERLAKRITEGARLVTQLTEDSAKIEKVLDVITNVAEQTNLLALNAAIEAARAGEQGRGFAVVADEVRTLAARTQESTLEIQRMIDALKAAAEDADNAMAESQCAGEETVSVFRAIGERLEAIAEGVNEINHANAEVAVISGQQRSTMESANHSVLTVQNDIRSSNLEVEHLSEVSIRLRALSDQLVKQSNYFQL